MKPLALLFIASAALGQSLTDPPPLLQIVQKPGYAAAAVKPYSDAHAAVNVIGLSAVTGLPESWFLVSHPNFGSLEDLDRALGAIGAPQSAASAEGGQDELLAPARTLLGAYQPQWSYRPEQASRMFPQARYFYVTIYRLRNGTEAAFATLADLRRANLESSNVARPDIAYEVISGAPHGTYIFVSPIVSLRAVDDGTPDTPQYALGLADARAEAKAKTAPSDISREHLLFRVEPRFSYVSDEFAAGNEGFWRGK